MVVLIKSNFQSDIRSFTLSSRPLFSLLRSAMCSLYALPACVMKYKDQDGDRVTLISTAELEHALASAEAQASGRPRGGQGALLRIRVLKPARSMAVRGRSSTVVRVIARSARTSSLSARAPSGTGAVVRASVVSVGRSVSSVVAVRSVEAQPARLGRRDAASPRSGPGVFAASSLAAQPARLARRVPPTSRARCWASSLRAVWQHSRPVSPGVVRLPTARCLAFSLCAAHSPPRSPAATPASRTLRSAGVTLRRRHSPRSPRSPYSPPATEPTTIRIPRGTCTPFNPRTSPVTAAYWFALSRPAGYWSVLFRPDVPRPLGSARTSTAARLPLAAWSDTTNLSAPTHHRNRTAADRTMITSPVARSPSVAWSTTTNLSVPTHHGNRTLRARTTVSSPRAARLLCAQRQQQRQLSTVKTLVRRTARYLAAPPGCVTVLLANLRHCARCCRLSFVRWVSKFLVTLLTS